MRTGILKGVGKPEGWENKTYFYPDSTITINEFEKGIHDFDNSLRASTKNNNSVLTIMKALKIMRSKNLFHFSLFDTPHFFDAISWGNELHLQHFDSNRAIKRYELAVMLDYYNRRFHEYSTDIQGKIKPN